MASKLITGIFVGLLYTASGTTIDRTIVPRAERYFGQRQAYTIGQVKITASDDANAYFVTNGLEKKIITCESAKRKKFFPWLKNPVTCYADGGSLDGYADAYFTSTKSPLNALKKGEDPFSGKRTASAHTVQHIRHVQLLYRSIKQE